MCRIGLLKGFDKSYTEKMASLQANGGNKRPEFFCLDDLDIVFNRFDVTSQEFPSGSFPIQSNKYVLAFNGEVFSYKDNNFNNSEFKCDALFALHYIEKDGFLDFFTNADLQGTFILIDKTENKTYVFVDQLNTTGCFYSLFENKIIVNQEYSIISELLEIDDIPEEQPIHILKNGSYLLINNDSNKVETRPLRNQYLNVWSGRSNTIPDLETICSEFNRILRKTIEDRIPKQGMFGILCGGGVDSSIILLHLSQILREKQEIDRLKIFCLGSEVLPISDEENDLINVQYLVESLGLTDNFIKLNERSDWFDLLLKRKVFNTHPRLINPNPSQTQIRHTVQMSCMLAQIAWEFPQIKCLLTGDFADEIFAGYNSMHPTNGSIEQLVMNIIGKLNDLPLNDASRITLSSLHGSSYLLKEIHLRTYIAENQNIKSHELINALFEKTSEELQQIAEEEGFITERLNTILSRIKPIEIRTPFSSHLLLDFIDKLNPNLLIGKIDGKIYNKYILRFCGIRCGLPAKNALRKKIPLNEGATGIRNGQRDPLEFHNAGGFISKSKLISNLQSELNVLKQFGILSYFENLRSGNQDGLEHLSFFFAGKNAGLQRLLNNDVFRDQMPDSNYSTDGNFNYNENSLINITLNER
jgi:asparagine synthetase B (glutamine-hydrolysing)